MNKGKIFIDHPAIAWLGIFLAPLVWLTQFLINYALAQKACASYRLAAIHFVSFISLAIVIAGGVIAGCCFAATSKHSESGEGIFDRPYFMATLATFSAGLYSLAILMQTIASFVLDPCQQ
jgi:hypothetical protein